MKKTFLILLGASLFYGCASTAGVSRTDKGTFVVSRSSSGISELNDLKTASIDEARRFCAGRGRTLQVVGVRGTEPPYYLTSLPEIEIEFMCSDRHGESTVVRAR